MVVKKKRKMSDEMKRRTQDRIDYLESLGDRKTLSQYEELHFLQDNLNFKPKRKQNETTPL